MKQLLLTGLSLFLVMGVFAQERKHTTKFEQLGNQLIMPNNYRTASGAPGKDYWQNEADYDINIELDDENQRISGYETITYHNNSPDPLNYLWVQLDQNVRAEDSHTYDTQTNAVKHQMSYRARGSSIQGMLDSDFDGGFKIASVTDENDKPLPYTINKTMMAVDMPETLEPGESFVFSVKWSYNINDRMEIGGRSGYEYFEKDGNYSYTIAQFFPRMCVYNDVEGWQNKQFLGSGEFALPFGDYIVKITVPADHVVGATGKLQNPESVLTPTQIERWEKAKTATEPVLIITQNEAEKAEKSKSKEKKTWIFQADRVRDFAFASSRKYIWDAMGVEVGDKTVMAVSYYPKEGNPLWEEYSTRTVALTLKVYSKYTIDYPYHKAISVHAARIGMEYPMICFNFGRPNEDGTYADQIKWGMIGVIIHEVGHNYFPMIINSDERQWTWMDEGLNTFTQYLTELEFEEEFGEKFPSRRGPPSKIVPYMKLDQSQISPIMTNSEQVQLLGPNAYAKPATALNILRETVMGRELFDRAFKEYATRWAFKHPDPADFFRTMEDASAVDLDWFWRGWFYTVDNVDIALTGLKKYKMSTDEAPDVPSEEPNADGFHTFYAPNLTKEEQKKLDKNMNYFELELENKGGLVMPVILEFTYTDGEKEIVRIPAEVWRKNDEKITKVFARTKDIEKVVLDPFQETADVDTENNAWPPGEQPSKMQIFKEKGGNR